MISLPRVSLFHDFSGFVFAHLLLLLVVCAWHSILPDGLEGGLDDDVLVVALGILACVA